MLHICRKKILPLLCLITIGVILAVIFGKDNTPIRYIETDYIGKNYFIAWCLPDKGISRNVIFRQTKMPVEKWLYETPRGYIRAAINGPLFNSMAGVPFREVGLGDKSWKSDPKWSTCPVQRYCFGMDSEVSSDSKTGVTKMVEKSFKTSPLWYYHAPSDFQKQYPYGFLNIGSLVDNRDGKPTVLSSDESVWYKMSPELEMRRSALAWTDKGDFIIIGCEMATWQQAGDFIANELIKLRPIKGKCNCWSCNARRRSKHSARMGLAKTARQTDNANANRTIKFTTSRACNGWG